MASVPRYCRLAVLLLSFGLVALIAPAAAPAAHPVPGSAGDTGVPADGPFRTPLVPVYVQCGTPPNPASGEHEPPVSMGSCLPPALTGPVSLAGPTSVGNVTMTKVPAGGGPAADDTIGVSISDVQCGPMPSAGCPAGVVDYGVGAGTDVYFTARVRITDHRNCAPVGCVGPYAAAGTAVEVDFPPTAIACAPSGAIGAPPGSTCMLGTSLNALAPGFVMPGTAAVFQIFRTRVFNAGPDSVLLDPPPVDDQLFEQQGIYNP